MTQENTIPTQACIAAHTGLWAADATWLNAMAEEYRAGRLAHVKREEREDDPGFEMLPHGIARIYMVGGMMKARSKYGGCCTLDVRQALRNAVAFEQVKGILLHIESPGGTVAGTEELANAIREADTAKPVFAHIDDLCASAGIWAASQARYVSANYTALAGGIGTLTVVEDSSGEAAASGIKVHVISTGEYKGSFTPGTEVKSNELAYLQNIIDGINKHFVAAVASGRAVDIETVESWADGRLFHAEDAHRMGMIDYVRPLQRTIEHLQAVVTEAEGGAAAVEARVRQVERNAKRIEEPGTVRELLRDFEQRMIDRRCEHRNDTRVALLEDPEIEVRAEDGKPARIFGYAAKYNSLSHDLGGFREVIRPGAFDDTLAEKPDISLRVQHAGGLTTVGRVANGTLKLSSDKTGLRYEAIPPDTTAGRDIVTLLKGGYLNKSSFAFTVRSGGENWDMKTNPPTRELRSVNLHDVAVVDGPAYEATTAEVRSRGAVELRTVQAAMEVAKESEQQPVDADTALKLEIESNMAKLAEERERATA